MKYGTKNTRIYLDTSVFLKEFSEEPKSEIIHRIFDLCSAKKLIIVISQWTINESIWALDKKHMKGELLEDERNYVIFGMLEKVNQLVSQGQIFQVSQTT